LLEQIKRFIPVYSAYNGANDTLFERASSLYLKKNDVIADITWGKGVFWKKINQTNYKIYKSDIKTCPEKYDFRNLPYEDDFFNCVVFDPPYVHNPGNFMFNDNYQNNETTKAMYHKDIIDLYQQGMKESKRILKENGTLFVKCQDEIETSKQKFSHIEIYDIATKELNFIAEDFFVLLNTKNPVVKNQNQKHARKNHSYLWVFKKLAEN